MVVSQSVVEKVTLPMHTLVPRKKSLPVRENGFKPRFGWEGHDPVEVVRHEDQQATMPSKLLVVKGS
jgi:hypothetical protein